MPLVAGVLESEQVAMLAYRLLAADPVLNVDLGVNWEIHRDQAPEGAPFPNVTLAPMSAVDTNTLGGEHVQQRVQLLVKVNGRFKGKSITYVDALLPIARRVHQALHGRGGVVDGVYVVKFRRTSTPYQPAEVRRGVRYPSLNQLFETEAQPAS
jgi:hypothetical protein